LQWKNLRDPQSFDFELEHVKCGANAKITFEFLWVFYGVPEKNLASFVSDAAPIMLR
jgi:hypothetical protein